MNTYTGTKKKTFQKQKEKTNFALIHQTENKASGQFGQSGCAVCQIQRGWPVMSTDQHQSFI